MQGVLSAQPLAREEVASAQSPASGLSSQMRWAWGSWLLSGCELGKLLHLLEPRASYKMKMTALAP